MPIIDESELDEAPASMTKYAAPTSGTVIDESQLDAAPGSVMPGDVEARKRQVAAMAAATPQNVSRERQSITGEIAGGIQQTLNDVMTMVSPKEKDMGVVERLLHGARAPMGLLRAAAPVLSLGTSPYIANTAATLGESASDALSKRGFTTLADVVGAGTTAAADVLSGVGQAKAAGALVKPVAKAMPLRTERTAALDKERMAQEAAVEAEAQAARQQALAARANVQSQADAALSSESSIAEAAKQNARQAAEAAKRGASTSAKAEALTTSKSTSEDIGRHIQEQVYNPKLTQSTQRFKKGYGDLEETGNAVKSDATEYQAAANKIFGKPESGVTRPLQTKAETVAGKVKSTLEIEDERFNELVDMADNAKRRGLNNADILAEEVQRRRAEMPSQPTLTDLLHERQRLKAAERAAYHIGDDGLGRQYKELQQAIGRDINKADKTFATKLSELDDAYRTEHAPFFSSQSEIRKAMDHGPEAVVDKLVPKATDVDRVAKVERLVKFADDPQTQKMVGDGFIRNMVGDATKLGEEKFATKIQSVWGRYADSRTGDKVLKTVLGDRYEPMRQLVEQTRKVKPATIDQQLAKATEQIEKATASRTSLFSREASDRMKTLDGVLGEGEKMIEGVKVAGKQGSIETNRVAKLTAIKKEFEEKAKKLGVHDVPEHGGQLVGTAMILHGLVGGVMGSGAALSQIISGGIVMMAAPAVMKLTNSARGLEMLNKLTRAIPGTAQAAAQARIVQQYLKDESKKEGGNE